MIIYIYGSESFKKEINSVLDHSNIKFRLDDHGEIKELKTLKELKNAIEEDPSNIYLIDDAKIIKKNALNQKIKFLKPKDGIEQEYLFDNGIGDISVDSIEELSKHIIKKLEAVIDEKESSEIQESIVEIVEDAYEKDEDTKDYIQLDDELSSLLSTREDSEDLHESFTSTEENIEEDDLSIPKDLSFEEDFGKIELIEDINIEENKNDINDAKQGVDMTDEFSEFDTLNEADILSALDGLDGNVVSDQAVEKKSNPSVSSSTSNETLNLSDSSADDIAKLISQLLNNKTLEITVKVKG